jgi:hypothetical protein
MIWRLGERTAKHNKINKHLFFLFLGWCFLGLIAVLPCVRFTGEERRIIRSLGFITYPEFIDNHYVQKGRSKVMYLIKHIMKYNVQYAIAPDYQYENALMLKRKFPHVKWIFPLHRKDEYKYAIQFDFVGFPHRKHFRDYSLEWFIRTFKNHHKWYLGFWNISKPEVLLNFDGFDTTIPETYAGKFGKIWITWNKQVKPVNMKTIDILRINLENFKKALEELQKQRNIHV